MYTQITNNDANFTNIATPYEYRNSFGQLRHRLYMVMVKEVMLTMRLKSREKLTHASTSVRRVIRSEMIRCVASANIW